MPTSSTRPIASLATLIAQGAPPSPASAARLSAGLAVVHPRDLVGPELPSAKMLDVAHFPDTPRTERAQVREGDVLVTGKGTQLRSAVVTAKSEGAVASANLLIVRLGAELLPEVLSAFLRSRHGQEQLLAKSSSSVAGAFVVTTRALGGLELIVPPMPVQRRLAEFTRASAAALAASERVLRLRSELYAGVVEEVLSGSNLAALSEMVAL